MFNIGDLVVVMEPWFSCVYSKDKFEIRPNNYKFFSYPPIGIILRIHKRAAIQLLYDDELPSKEEDLFLILLEDAQTTHWHLRGEIAPYEESCT